MLYGIKYKRIKNYIKIIDMKNNEYKYTIEMPFKGLGWDGYKYEVSIMSEHLAYSEIGGGCGAQVRNAGNREAIVDRCKKIGELIREIDDLNS
jgi:hypothetical protein